MAKNEVVDPHQYDEIRKKCRRWHRWYPMKKKKIVFSQFGGKGYGCNPRAICDEFLKRNAGYDLVWILGASGTRESGNIPDGVRIVKGDQALYELITAKVWINNIHFVVNWDKGLLKKKKTIYLNTFHGGITIKTEGKDKHTYKEKAYEDLSLKEKCYRMDADNVDYVTCACDVEKHVLDEFFYGKGEILKLGDPRTDMLVNGSPEDVKRVRDFYQIEDGTKVLVYAPTFRPDMKLDAYTMDYSRVLDTLEEMDGCPWKMLIRLHPRLAGKTKKIIPAGDERLINAASYPDMQELALAADIMVSDYSSTITDFMLTRKPAFMYVPDLEYYIKKRGLYFNVDELPFPYSLDNDQLIEQIKTFDSDKYKADVDAFIERIGYLADGHSAERVVDFLISKM